ncbi:MAG: cyclase family protein [Chloroflexi bacterium]|nr:cyclase family protein [Chloroflexota bacterium]
MKGRIYDISLPIYPGMAVWPGNPETRLEPVKSIARGDSSNVSLLHVGTHSGTHVDAPRHYIAGAAGADRLGIETLWARARVVQLPGARGIDPELLRRLDLEGVTHLLLGTGNSALLKQRPLSRDYAFLAEDGARYLVDIGIRLVGIDYLSIEEFQKPGRPAHHVLLQAGVIIIEGIDLAGVPSGDYELVCLPLKIQDADGAPARVLVREL